MTKVLDEEIAKLQHIKRLLEGSGGLSPAFHSLVNSGNRKPGRVMSEEGRRRIAEAQRRRWAKAKRLQ